MHDAEPTDLVSMSAHELLRGYAAAQFTPAEVLEAVHRRMDEQEPTLNAFYVREQELASMQAKASTERWRTGPASPGGAFGRGVIDGVPVTFKENIATQGTPCPAGTAAYADAGPADTDAPVATLVSAAGGVRLGKTVMPDLGMLSSGVSSLHGVTRSPWNPEWTPGGSSAGAGAAAAARLGPLHIGSDIGGSVRLPAGWTGLASLKPSFGTVPVDPPYQGRAIGPLARSVDDVALLMQVLAREDPPAPRTTPICTAPNSRGPSSGSSRSPTPAVKQLRVGVHTDAGSGMATDAEVAAAVDRVAECFAEAGAAVEQVDPFFAPGPAGTAGHLLASAGVAIVGGLAGGFAGAPSCRIWSSGRPRPPSCRVPPSSRPTTPCRRSGG